ncbi:hypothetical protein BWI75_06445 [Gloeocapsopsis sp. AAB1 = 1H9]|uniref:Methyltransferase FkbM domain-containing protein n=1 Tax=Gloeocapsopsis dulcis AAB1 = 1H9 TaxID=1433147 RepID=A0A6N8FT16_9CHRO|nr:hypothetical protein [Gloeocapsopsis dulcis AAB1 = 1H9]
MTITIRTSFIHRLYLRLLNAYSRYTNRFSVYRIAFRYFIKTLVIVGTKTLDVQFPSRVTGGWWWTWRWRWEMIMQWHEYETVQWCQQLVKPGMVVLDIGAHIGYFTWLFSDLVGPSGKVIAFEPCPENYPLLLHNIKARGCHVAEPVCVALSDEIGEVDLFISKGNTTHSLNKEFTQNQEGSVRVRSTTVDAYMANLNHPLVGFVKMDVEGVEPKVLTGMMDTIYRNPELVMVVELNPEALEAGGYSAEELIAQLEALGFVPKAIKEDGELVPPFEDSSRKVQNLLCLRA